MSEQLSVAVSALSGATLSWAGVVVTSRYPLGQPSATGALGSEWLVLIALQLCLPQTLVVCGSGVDLGWVLGSSARLGCQSVRALMRVFRSTATSLTGRRARHRRFAVPLSDRHRVRLCDCMASRYRCPSLGGSSGVRSGQQVGRTAMVKKILELLALKWLWDRRKGRR